MLRKKNKKLKIALTTATVLTVLVTSPATQAFASNDTNTSVKTEINTSIETGNKTPDQMVNDVVNSINNVIDTENVTEMDKVLNDAIQVRRDLVKRLKISKEDPLVIKIKNKTQRLTKKIKAVIEIKVEKEQAKLSNTYKNAETIPLVQNPNWYNSGFPQKVKVREIESSPETVIIDIIAEEDKEIKDGVCYDAVPIDYFESTYQSRYPIDITMLAHTKVQGYMDKNGNIHKDPKTLPSGYYKSGELLYSLLIDANDPLVKGTKVINRSYWDLCLGTTLGKNQSTNLTKDTSHGVDNSEAINIAKTTGTNFSIGATIGATKVGTGSGTINYSIQNSLTKTFSRSISISQRETDSIRHVFEKGDTERKVGLYQFVETFEQIPNSECSDGFGINDFELASHYANDKDIKFVFNRSSELKTKEFTTVDIEKGQVLINPGKNIK